MESDIQSIDNIKLSIQNHQAFHELKLFGENLKQTQLDRDRLKIFFATMGAFFRETPSGILSLALRVHDYWMNVNVWDAMSKSAYILSTAVDEFGLEKMREHFSPSHHQLFRVTTSHFGITSDDLLDENNILDSGRSIRHLSFEYYRNKPILQSLGFHLASELTSWYEFTCFLNGFLANKTHYQIESQNDPAIKFFLIHTLVEPSHLLHSEKIIHAFLKEQSTHLQDISKGAEIYMNYYFKLFNELNCALFL